MILIRVLRFTPFIPPSAPKIRSIPNERTVLYVISSNPLIIPPVKTRMNKIPPTMAPQTIPFSFLILAAMYPPTKAQITSAPITTPKTASGENVFDTENMKEQRATMAMFISAAVNTPKI